MLCFLDGLRIISVVLLMKRIEIVAVTRVEVVVLRIHNGSKSQKRAQKKHQQETPE
jgi:hypothetical protein